MSAVANFAQEQSAFGMMGVFGKGSQRQMLKQVRVLEKTNLQEAEDWCHVGHFLDHRRRLRQLAVRWNALAHEGGLDALPGTEPEHGLAALEQYRLFELIVAVVEGEKSVGTRAGKLFLSFEPARRMVSDAHARRLLADALQHHLNKNRLSNVWATKERFQKVLQGKTGAIVSDLRQFLAEMLGNPSVEDAQMQAQWTALMAELARVQGLSDVLALWLDITERMAENGAPLWAAQCRLPLTAAN